MMKSSYHWSQKFPTGSWQHVLVHSGSSSFVSKCSIDRLNESQGFKWSWDSLNWNKISDQDQSPDRAPGHWDGSLDEIAIFNYLWMKVNIKQFFKWKLRSSSIEFIISRITRSLTTTVNTFTMTRIGCKHQQIRSSNEIYHKLINFSITLSTEKPNIIII